MAGVQKPGFFLNFGEDTKIIAETRFLGLGAGTQKPGFFLNLGEDTKIIAETRFLSWTWGRGSETRFLPKSW